jgi:hypothetical protein
VIRAVYRKGRIQPVEAVPKAWRDGQELFVEEVAVGAEPNGDDNWLADLRAAAAQIPERVHAQVEAALARQEAESKEQVRREMERSR